MDPRKWNLKWAGGLVGAVVVGIAATLITLTVLNDGKERATAQEEPAATETAVQTATATVQVTGTPTSSPNPEPAVERCPADWALYGYPDAGYSACIPPGWVVIDNSGKEPEGTNISIFDPDLAPFAGKPAGGSVPGGVKMGIRVASASSPDSRSNFDNPSQCPTRATEQISGRQVDVCSAKATDPGLPTGRFLPGEEKGVIWAFPPVNGRALIAGAGFDSPVSAADDAAVVAIVQSIRQ